MNAFKWTQAITPPPNVEHVGPGLYRFGFDQAGLAADLRALADALDARQITAFDVTTTQSVKHEGWTGQTVTITLSGHVPGDAP